MDNQEKDLREEILKQEEELTQELTALMNHYSMDTLADTPDYILGEYLHTCLRNYIVTKEKVNHFFGKKVTVLGVEDID